MIDTQFWAVQGKNTEHGTVTHAAFYLKTNKQQNKK